MSSAGKTNSIYVDGLGSIVVRRDVRAKRFIFRVRQNRLLMTAPKQASEKELMQAASSMHGKLRSLLEANKTPRIDLDFSIRTSYFELEIREGNQEKFYAQSELGKLLIISPHQCSFEDPSLQEWLQKVIVEALRRNAKIILPPMLYALARKHRITYQQLKINTSKTRWGSCSRIKNINLSAYLILLPKHLIEYVLLHELAHTKEMNHGPNFWAYLDQLTQGKAQVLNQELKAYQTSLFIP